MNDDDIMNIVIISLSHTAFQLELRPKQSMYAALVRSLYWLAEHLVSTDALEVIKVLIDHSLKSLICIVLNQDFRLKH